MKNPCQAEMVKPKDAGERQETQWNLIKHDTSTKVFRTLPKVVLDDTSTKDSHILPKDVIGDSRIYCTVPNLIEKGWRGLGCRRAQGRHTEIN
ncbi:14438_t:CDS:2 [Entrophospora sp. SA101]|nr:14438_t:CDS:2 [Entrophospora sp. SA101]